MFYSIRHVTRFRYSAPVRESVMELRMQPRSEGPQTLRSFQISTNPRAQLYAYTDHLGNAVYHFNMLREHEELRIEAQATVEIGFMPQWPETLDPLEWGRYNSFNLHDDQFDMLEPSKFARPSPELESFMKIAELEKPVGDPMTALKTLQRGIYDSFEYQSGVTEVNSPIEVALEQRRGVCQDFAHIMTAIARAWGIPTRYVSGYLYHKGSRDRSAADATHAWVEAYLPSLGWVGFDPPTISWRPNAMSAPRWAVTMPMCRQHAVLIRAMPTANSPSRYRWSRRRRRVRHEDFLKVARPMAAPPPTPSMPERLYHQQQQQQQ